jgi:hypothetical protein
MPGSGNRMQPIYTGISMATLESVPNFQDCGIDEMEGDVLGAVML